MRVLGGGVCRNLVLRFPWAHGSLFANSVFAGNLRNVTAANGENQLYFFTLLSNIAKCSDIKETKSILLFCTNGNILRLFSSTLFFQRMIFLWKADSFSVDVKMFLCTFCMVVFSVQIIKYVC